jgi:uncharacterized protein YcfJ
MKNIIYAIILSLMPSVSYADGYVNEYATIVSVQPIYKDNYVPVSERICRDVEVPIYENRRGSTGDTLAGAIVGGLIGNQFGNGSGKDAMTMLGAIVGADAASNKRDAVIGYRVERRCEYVESYVNQPLINHYRIQFEYNGKHYTQDTNSRYEVGQRVRVNTTLR